MSDHGPFEPPRSMFGDLFGVMKMAADPQMQQGVMQMMQIVMHSAAANLRIEAKLDFILTELGHDPRRFEHVGQPAGPGHGPIGPALLERRADAGIGAAAPASDAAHNGTGTAEHFDPYTYRPAVPGEFD